MRELPSSFKIGKEFIRGTFKFMGYPVDVRDEIVELYMWY